MDHAEVLDRLDAAFVGPGKLWTVEGDGTDEGVALREHLAACAACRTEYEALLATAAVLAAGAPDSLRPPAEARDRLLTRVHELGTPRLGAAQGAGRGAVVVPFARPRRRPRGVLAGLAVAASIVLFAVGAAVGHFAFPATESASDEISHLASLTGTIDWVLGQPEHRTARLQTPSMTDGGTVLVSADRKWVVVISDALHKPAQGERFGCFVERDGQRTQIGWMQFSDELAYWDGEVSKVSDIGRPGDHLVVVGSAAQGTPELTAAF